MYRWIDDTRESRRRAAAAAGVSEDVLDRAVDAFLREMGAVERAAGREWPREGRRDATGAFAPPHVCRGASAGRGF